MKLPTRRFSGYGKWPTRLEGWQQGLCENGESYSTESCSGTLWLAPADFALCERWLLDVGATLTWEALELHCRHRAAITAAVGSLLSDQQRMAHVRWCHAEYDRHQMRSSDAFERIWRELCAGGVVVCWCLQGQHRGPASMIAFFMSCLGVEFPNAREIVKQHRNCKIDEYIKLDALELMTVRRHVQVVAARAAAAIADTAAVAKGAAQFFAAATPKAPRSARTASLPCRGRSLTADILERRDFENSGVLVCRPACVAATAVSTEHPHFSQAECVAQGSGSASSGEQVVAAVPAPVAAATEESVVRVAEPAAVAPAMPSDSLAFPSEQGSAKNEQPRQSMPVAEAAGVGSAEAVSAVQPAGHVSAVAVLEALQPEVRSALLAIIAQQPVASPTAAAAAGAAAPFQSGGERRRARRQLEQAMVSHLPEDLLQAAQGRALSAVMQEMHSWRRDRRVLRAIAQAAINGKGGTSNAKGNTRESVARAAEPVSQGDAKGMGKGKGKGKGNGKGKGKGKADMLAFRGKKGKGRFDANVAGAAWHKGPVWGGGCRIPSWHGGRGEPWNW